MAPQSVQTGGKQTPANPVHTIKWGGMLFPESTHQKDTRKTRPDKRK
jgi:hypothetical protein